MNIFALNIALAIAWAALTGNITLSGWSGGLRASAPPAFT
jgi:multisubunit Na+/H+ antiporter MnhE subunit